MMMLIVIVIMCFSKMSGRSLCRGPTLLWQSLRSRPRGRGAKQAVRKSDASGFNRACIGVINPPVELGEGGLWAPK